MKALNNEDKKRLCVSLAHCDSEDEVVTLLKRHKLWDDSAAWKNYGDNENNFATIGNQQSRPEAALVEKIINSVDAVLMAECLRRGINPESKESPKSITEALEEYFGISEGKLTSISAKQRTELANNISLVASGLKSSPCYTIIDKGEGQTPNSMPNTLLSLGKSNKLRIPFVQGKFNMGGTGVFQFCGKHNLQLIISKRHPEVAEYDNDKSKLQWGYTIVRREDPRQGVRSSTYRYLAPDNKVLSFEGDGLPLLPGVYPEPYEQHLQYGTFIKLYNYQIPGLRTAIILDLYNRLALLMPQVALPIRLYERRKGYSSHSPESTLSGLSVRLEEDRYKNLEEGFPTSVTLSILGQKMKASIFAFKRDQEEKYKKDEGIIFTVNGQTHGRISKDFFSRGAVKMGYLANSILVIVDCSEIDGRSREDLFMNSRDRLRGGELKAAIEKKLEDEIRNHQGLQELREKRRREEIQNKLKDDKPLAEVIQNLLKKSPSLSNLLSLGGRVKNPFRTTDTDAAEKFRGRQFPTVFTLIEKYPEDKPKNCHINTACRIKYKTDARNDYFDRDVDPGSLTLKINDKESKDYSLNLWNGNATLTMSLPIGVQVGDVLTIESVVTDKTQTRPFTEEFFIRVIEPQKKTSGSTRNRTPPASKDPGNKGKDISHMNIPNVIEVSKTEWDRHGFDQESALKVFEAGEGTYDFFVNIDNVFLRTEQKYLKLDPNLLKARFKYGMVVIGMAFLSDYERKQNKEDETDERDIFSLIFSSSKVIAPFLLPMIAELGELEIEEEAGAAS